MSNSSDGTLLPDDLQFDRAEQAGAAPVAAQVTCTACKAHISTEYHVLNGAVICARCRQRVEAQLAAGGGASRVPLALLYGAGAAVAGAILYVAVALITGYTIGLIAVAVGWMVGKAVRKASGGVGGPVYQAIAVGFAYLSMLTLYAYPMLSRGLVQGVEGVVSILFLPFTQGVSNILGLVIMGFGLFEAWRLNAPAHVALSGPYQVRADVGPLAGTTASV
jgi:hypothetical protein